jgi:hypothetical protein
MTKCPKCGYVRKAADTHINPLVCPACGIAYAKWISREQAANAPPEPNETFVIKSPAETPEGILAVLTEVPTEVHPILFAGRLATWLGLFVWGGYFIAKGIDWESVFGSFMHNINLPFHEFGHLLFMPFGRFMHILGGSLFQVLLPLGLGIAFIYYQNDTFGASVMLWWAGQSLVDVSPYIADAKHRLIPLVGGASEEFHDWGNLLTMLNWVDSAKALARLDFGLGAALMLLASAWGAYVLYKQMHKLKW